MRVLLGVLIVSLSGCVQHLRTGDPFVLTAQEIASFSAETFPPASSEPVIVLGKEWRCSQYNTKSICRLENPSSRAPSGGARYIVVENSMVVAVLREEQAQRYAQSLKQSIDSSRPQAVEENGSNDSTIAWAEKTYGPRAKTYFEDVERRGLSSQLTACTREWNTEKFPSLNPMTADALCSCFVSEVNASSYPESFKKEIFQAQQQERKIQGPAIECAHLKLYFRCTDFMGLSQSAEGKVKSLKYCAPYSR